MEKEHVVGSLKDFDWQLNLALSSDSLATLNEPLVNLDLEIVSSNKKKQTNSVEMNASELKTLVSILEEAEQALLEAGN